MPKKKIVMRMTLWKLSDFIQFFLSEMLFKLCDKLAAVQEILTALLNANGNSSP
jgi:hypothetical protein